MLISSSKVEANLGYFIKKSGKRDFTFIKSYKVISLLNYMGKLVEKVKAKQLI